MIRRGGLVTFSQVAFSLFTALTLAELGLRVLGVEYPVFYESDAHLGSVLLPGASGWFRNEGRSWVMVNAAGMRDHA